VPSGVSSVKVLVVGGGGGGSVGPQGAGGSGYINSGIFFVDPGQNIAVTVGVGGAGAPDNGSEPGEDGSHSSFGTLLAAAGGKRGTFGNPINGSPGGNGGSGGGAGGYDCASPAGGMDGLNGSNCNTFQGGTGQGNWSVKFGNFSSQVFSPGQYGQGSKAAYFDSRYFYAGGGGGGVLFDGAGPTAGDGKGIYSGDGGDGYGAGGGAGGFNPIGPIYYEGGGEGASGFVYIEWGFQ